MSQYLWTWLYKYIMKIECCFPLKSRTDLFPRLWRVRDARWRCASVTSGRRRVMSSLRRKHGGYGRGRFHRTEQAAVGFSRHVSQHFRKRKTLEEQEGVYIQKHQRLWRPSPGSAARDVYGVGEPRVPGLQVRIKALTAATLTLYHKQLRNAEKQGTITLKRKTIQETGENINKHGML